MRLNLAHAALLLLLAGCVRPWDIQPEIKPQKLIAFCEGTASRIKTRCDRVTYQTDDQVRQVIRELERAGL